MILRKTLFPIAVNNLTLRPLSLARFPATLTSRTHHRHATPLMQGRQARRRSMSTSSGSSSRSSVPTPPLQRRGNKGNVQSDAPQGPSCKVLYCQHALWSDSRPKCPDSAGLRRRAPFRAMHARTLQSADFLTAAPLAPGSTGQLGTMTRPACRRRSG